MSNSISNEIGENVEDALDLVARSLRDASERTQDLSEDASEVLASAADDVVRIAERLREHAVYTARDVVRNTTREVQQHPIASLAAALTAVAALLGVIAAARNRNSTSRSSMGS